VGLAEQPVELAKAAGPEEDETMSKKNEHNPKLIFAVKDVRVEGHKVFAFGEAGTNATSPRLVRSVLRPDPETLLLDFEADDGLLQVITPVEATFEIEHPERFTRVTVHARSGSITRELTHGGEKADEAHHDFTLTGTAFSPPDIPETGKRPPKRGDTFMVSGPATTIYVFTVKAGTIRDRGELTQGLLESEESSFSTGVLQTIHPWTRGKFVLSTSSTPESSGGPHAPGDGTIDVGGGDGG
jgi:hypothetical protein